jgi:excisionase family DNA binding protein
MSEEERYFTIKETAKLLGVPKASIKRRIKSKDLRAYKRLGKRGRELVIPQRVLSLEIMSFVPNSRQLNLGEFETILINRFKAMAAERDQKISVAVKQLCEEFAQLRAEINAFDASVFEDKTPVTALSKGRSVTGREQERMRLPLPTRPYAALRLFKNE